MIASPFAVTITEDLEPLYANDSHASLSTMLLVSRLGPAFRLSIQLSKSRTSHRSLSSKPRPEVASGNRRELCAIALIIGRGTRLLIFISARDNHHIAQSREDKMSKPIFILNGPNLNLLGQREPEIYGRVTLEEVREKCEARAKSLGREIDFRQTNFEGTLIESVHEARQKACGIIINPAGWTFTSIALLDSLKMFEGPKIELHITNVHKRESIYHKSLISLTATGLILGLGTYGYEVAVDAINQMIGAG